MARARIQVERDGGGVHDDPPVAVAAGDLRAIRANGPRSAAHS